MYIMVTIVKNNSQYISKLLRLWQPDAKSQLIGKHPDGGKD